MLEGSLPCGNSSSETEKMYLSRNFARLEITNTLVSDNRLAFLNSELTQLCEALGIKLIESPIYHRRANGLAVSYSI